MHPLNHLCFFVCFCPPQASSNSRSRHATVKNTITNMSCSLGCLDEQFHEDSRSTSRNDKTCLDTDAYKNIKSSNFLQIIFQTDLNHLTTAAKSVVAMNTYFFHVQDLRKNFFEIPFFKRSEEAEISKGHRGLFEYEIQTKHSVAGSEENKADHKDSTILH